MLRFEGLSLLKLRQLILRMSIFTQSFDPITGCTNWEEKDPDYDYHQEVARSAFADMLHDHERNEKYHMALKKAIEKKHKYGQKAHVLDIGTGTGLLSMMAAKCGADTITACEAFRPMAECAAKIIKDNGFESNIKLVRKRSTDMTVGVEGDMPNRANILVTEVFDTELIGEGALSTFKHAHDKLLEKDCIVIPSSAIVWAQVIESSTVQRWNRINSIKDPETREILIEPPAEVTTCPGSSAVHDIQLSQLPFDAFKSLAVPQKIFTFDWSGREPLLFDERKICEIQATATGTAHAVFMWWQLSMDEDGEVILSCAPVWQHPDVLKSKNITSMRDMTDKIPWRDHWMQAIYYFPKDTPMRCGEKINLIGYHDEYTFWFQLTPSTSEITKSPVCHCSLHCAYSRTRISQLNDKDRNDKYINVLRKIIHSDTVCVSFSDGSLLGLAAAKLGAKRVILFEPNYLSRRSIERFIIVNNLTEKVRVIQSLNELENLADDKPNLVIGEPYYVNCILPWDNLRFWYLVSSYTPDIPTVPVAARIYGVAVEFKDLHKIRTPLRVCQGFDHTTFDKLVLNSSEISDNPVEAHPLWEYPAKALSASFQLATFDFTTNFDNTRETLFSGESLILKDGSCNGIALWIDWQLNAETVVTTGPNSPIEAGKIINWDLNTRQGVFLLRNITNVRANDNLLWSIKHHFGRDRFLDFNFTLNVKS